MNKCTNSFPVLLLVHLVAYSSGFFFYFWPSFIWFWQLQTLRALSKLLSKALNPLTSSGRAVVKWSQWFWRSALTMWSGVESSFWLLFKMRVTTKTLHKWRKASICLQSVTNVKCCRATICQSFNVGVCFSALRLTGKHSLNTGNTLTLHFF